MIGSAVLATDMSGRPLLGLQTVDNAGSPGPKPATSAAAANVDVRSHAIRPAIMAPFENPVMYTRLWFTAPVAIASAIISLSKPTPSLLLVWAPE